MKAFLMVALISMATSVSLAKSKKVDWSLCAKEIKESCPTAKDDHDKYECLEKLAKEKISEQCREKNEKVEAEMKKSNHKH